MKNSAICNQWLTFENNHIPVCYESFYYLSLSVRETSSFVGMSEKPPLRISHEAIDVPP